MAKSDLPKTSSPRNCGCNASNTPAAKLLRMGVGEKALLKPSPKTPA